MAHASCECCLQLDGCTPQDSLGKLRSTMTDALDWHTIFTSKRICKICYLKPSGSSAHKDQDLSSSCTLSCGSTNQNSRGARTEGQTSFLDCESGRRTKTAENCGRCDGRNSESVGLHPSPEAGNSVDSHHITHCAAQHLPSDWLSTQTKWCNSCTPGRYRSQAARAKCKDLNHPVSYECDRAACSRFMSCIWKSTEGTMETQNDMNKGKFKSAHTGIDEPEGLSQSVANLLRLMLSISSDWTLLF